MPLDAKTTDLATVAYLRRKGMLAEAIKDNINLTMVSDGGVRNRAALDLLRAAKELMGDEPMAELIGAYVTGTEIECSMSRSAADDEALMACGDAFDEHAPALYEHFHSLAEVA